MRARLCDLRDAAGRIYAEGVTARVRGSSMAVEGAPSSDEAAEVQELLDPAELGEALRTLWEADCRVLREPMGISDLPAPTSTGGEARPASEASSRPPSWPGRRVRPSRGR